MRRRKSKYPKYLAQNLWICHDCKVYSGHPIVWCPSCGKKLQKFAANGDDIERLKDVEGYKRG